MLKSTVSWKIYHLCLARLNDEGVGRRGIVDMKGYLIICFLLGFSACPFFVKSARNVFYDKKTGSAPSPSP